MKHICSALKRNGEKGFTLVELIVVIAILAILAAVAYPVYTGYITKANEAADLTLLGHVNESFASALYDVGYYDGLPPKTFDLGTDKVHIGDNGAIRLASKKLPDDGLTDSNALDAAFDRYYKGNEDMEFKVFETLIYDPSTGGFGGAYGNVRVLANNWKMESKDNGNGTTSFTVTDTDGNVHHYTVNNDDVTNYNGSNFKEMGIPNLMNEVNNVVEAASKLALSFGGNIDPEILEKYHIDRETYPDDASYEKALANTMVLQVAEATANAKPEKLNELVAGLRRSHTLSLSVGGPDDLDSGAAMAAAYAMITAYANSDIGKTQQYSFGGKTMTAAEYYEQETSKFSTLSDTQAVGAVMGMLNTMMNAQDASGKNGFDTYYDEYGAEDLAGYVSALTAINDNMDTLVNQDGVVGKGFVNDDLAEILGAILGG